MSNKGKENQEGPKCRQMQRKEREKKIKEKQEKKAWWEDNLLKIIKLFDIHYLLQ